MHGVKYKPKLPVGLDRRKVLDTKRQFFSRCLSVETYAFLSANVAIDANLSINN